MFSTNQDEKKIGQSYKSNSILYVLLAVIIIASNSLFLSFNNRLQAQLDQQKELEEVIAQQNTNIQVLQDALSDSEGDTVTLEELIKQFESQTIFIDNQEKVIAGLQGLLKDKIESDNLAVYTSCTVQNGDTLSRDKHGISYLENAKNILALNGIVDENLIYVGQILIFPINDREN